MQKTVELEYFGLSDIGMVRTRNEDFWQVNLDSRVVAIADGMGGRLGGEVASYEAVVRLIEMINAYHENLEDLEDEKYKEALQMILSKVNGLIYEHSLVEAHLRGMGTTLSFMHFLQNKAWLFHIGDSRIYRLRNGVLSCLTEDHSLENRLKNRYKLPKQSDKMYSYRHILTNVLGSRPYIVPDIREITYEKEDLYVLCSDGLTNMVSDADIREILTQPSTLEESSNILISLANSRGGSDNVTVVLVRVQ
ncbi:phosphatase 2C family protein [Chlamydia ibidis]|uniref:Phosphatase 2C family protein n=2 Tax=Chlamydia ibidis TaxID=1405396 RepID=S7KHN7_9CHLA|nr:PP2C family serine/threonine-protein phosphatase [Chlamydia ibidis]EPP35676.1 phosphatase 2C family protein [Chlamydia ibidis]EQM62581.1 phosphatase 2C family protein [Chlamydia ibidis 10-1398/6]